MVQQQGCQGPWATVPRMGQRLRGRRAWEAARPGPSQRQRAVGMGGLPSTECFLMLRQPFLQLRANHSLRTSPPRGRTARTVEARSLGPRKVAGVGY